jgi:hypothetical protein
VFIHRHCDARARFSQMQVYDSPKNASDLRHGNNGPSTLLTA